MDGVPNLTRSSERHTEEHHLIRCMPPEKIKDTASSTEQRLMSLEGRIDDLSSRIGNIEQLLHRLASKIG